MDILPWGAFFSLAITTGFFLQRIMVGGPKENGPPYCVSTWHRFGSGGISFSFIARLLRGLPPHLKCIITPQKTTQKSSTARRPRAALAEGSKWLMTELPRLSPPLAAVRIGCLGQASAHAPGRSSRRSRQARSPQYAHR